jgi:hypothetical protein
VAAEEAYGTWSPVGGTGVITVGALIGMAAHLGARAARCSTSPACAKNGAVMK